MAKEKKSQAETAAPAAPTVIEKPSGPTDPKWHDYIMSQFTPEELKDGKYPSCDGLRRMFELNIGKITRARSTVIQAADIRNSNRATVCFEIQYLEHSSGMLLEISDVADASNDNYEPPYNAYPTATASTSAEGRVYRKGLRLRTACGDEFGTVNRVGLEKALSPHELISESQVAAINTLCEQKNIDITKLLGLFEEESILRAIKYEKATLILKSLNEFTRGKEIPASILKE